MAGALRWFLSDEIGTAERKGGKRKGGHDAVGWMAEY